jgi:hypothetical protein
MHTYMLRTCTHTHTRAREDAMYAAHFSLGFSQGLLFCSGVGLVRVQHIIKVDGLIRV